MPWQPHRLAVWNDATPAGVEAPETGSARQFKCAAEFVGGNAAVYFREARFGFGFVRGIILVHHVHIGVARHGEERQVKGRRVHSLPDHSISTRAHDSRDRPIRGYL